MALPHFDHLTLTPFLLCVLSHPSQTPGVCYLRKISNNPASAQTALAPTMQLWLKPNSCPLIKSKQPLTKLLACYLRAANHLINLGSPDVRRAMGLLPLLCGSRMDKRLGSAPNSIQGKLNTRTQCCILLGWETEEVACTVRPNTGLLAPKLCK